MLTKIVAESNETLHTLASIVTKSPQVIVNFPATPEQKQSLKSSDQARRLLLDYSHQLEPLHGRLLVRPSGTEPLIRITIWGDSESTIDKLAHELKAKLGELL
jgi:phosphoglucosamine mutase